MFVFCFHVKNYEKCDFMLLWYSHATTLIFTLCYTFFFAEMCEKVKVNVYIVTNSESTVCFNIVNAWGEPYQIQT